MFACLFIRDFPVEAMIRFERALRPSAIVVLDGHPPLEKVVALNERARQAGVDIGTTKAQLEAWQDLVLRNRSDSQEQSTHAALLDCAQSFSPEVEDTAPGTALMNLAGLEQLLGAPPKIAHALAQQVAKLGLEPNVAVAANPDAALLAARGFPGVTLIPEKHEANRLGSLPLDVLLECFSADATESVRWAETFDRWGIRTLRALAALPEVPLIERLGQQGLRLQRLARGATIRGLRVLEPRLIFAENIELEDPIVLLEPLTFLLNRMLEQLSARLQAHSLAVQELRLNLELAITSPDDCSSFSSTQTFSRILRLPVPMLDAKVFLKLLQLDLQANPPGAPVTKIHLSVESARPRASQAGLFQPVFPEPEKLELTLARIAGIVGQQRVGSVELQDTHRRGAFELQHFAPPPPADESSTKKRKRNMHQPESGNAVQITEEIAEEQQQHAQKKMSAVIALRLFRPPLSASVTVRDLKPVAMRCSEREEMSGDIVWAAGPWRSSGDWSEPAAWSRDEWDIAVSIKNDLVLYRLVQDKLSGKWLIEGMYD